MSRLDFAAYFVSDIHITGVNDSRYVLLCDFLESHFLEGNKKLEYYEKYPKPTHLFLLGDIFDLWIADHSYFINQYTRFINLIKKINEKISIHYFAGNHDLYLEKFWKDQMNVKVYEHPMDLKIGEIKFHLEHGDLMNPDDKGYLFLKKILENKFIKTLAHKLPGFFINRFGNWASSKSRVYTNHTKSLNMQSTQALIRNFAKNLYIKKPFDYFVAGHVHLEDVFKISDRVYAINLGSWYKSQKLLCVTNENFQFVDLEPFRLPKVF